MKKLTILFLSIFIIIIILSIPALEAYNKKEILPSISAGDCRIVNTILALENKYDIYLYGKDKYENKHIVAVSKDRIIYDISRDSKINQLNFDNHIKTNNFNIEGYYSFENLNDSYFDSFVYEYYIKVFIFAYKLFHI